MENKPRKKKYAGNSLPEVLRINSLRAENGCLEWQGNMNKHGYGALTWGGRPAPVYRHAYEAVHGPIPKGLFVRHSCDNRKCIEISHLLIGTHQQNMNDMTSRGRQAKGEKNASAKLTEDRVIAIRLDPRSHYSMALAEGVHKNVVAQIRRGKSWRHIPLPYDPKNAPWTAANKLRKATRGARE